MNRYSFNTEEEALELLNALELEKGQTCSKDIHGIMIWGFEDKQVTTFDEDGLPLVDIIKGTTYNVDVVWKGEQPNEWSEFEVFPSSPSHTIS